MAKAELLTASRRQVRDNAFIEIRIWRLPEPARGSTHDYKYRLALVVANRCVLRYDNEAGKGDHRHIDDAEMPIEFVGIDRLIADFERDVREWLLR